MSINPGQMKDMQERMTRDVELVDEKPLSEVKYIAGLSTAYQGQDVIATAVVMRWPSEEVIEKKIVRRKAPMNFIPGLEAFRDGPILMEAYYELEYTPDIIIVKGHGIAHPQQCGTAVYIGHETQKPTIGVAQKPLVETKDDTLIMNEEVVGTIIKTREHSNPLYISPGNKITIETAKEIITKNTHHPHKLPEALHIATRLAKKETKPKEEEEELIEES